jgi:hypothetical protein
MVTPAAPGRVADWNCQFFLLNFLAVLFLAKKAKKEDESVEDDSSERLCADRRTRPWPFRLFSPASRSFKTIRFCFQAEAPLEEVESCLLPA